MIREPFGTGIFVVSPDWFPLVKVVSSAAYLGIPRTYEFIDDDDTRAIFRMKDGLTVGKRRRASYTTLKSN
jgi:hypothetical protein